MSDLETKDKRSPLLVILMVVVLGGLGCVVAVAGVIWPAFDKYLRKSKAVEAEINTRVIAESAKAYYENQPAGECRFPDSAGPLPPLLDCCAETCRRTEDQLRSPGWQQIEFSTLEHHRFAYQTFSEDDRYVVRATADLDCDGDTSLYELTVEARPEPDGTCLAVVGTPVEENPYE